MLCNMPREGEPVHRAGHVNVRKEQHGALPMLCEVNDRLIAVKALVNAKAGIFEDVRRIHHDDRIVFDDNDIGDG